ncbi:MAG: hypothetical protein HPY75_07525 [Actinobacteria bacterium]|nr:hypothetical protein [Actinomycetota bacterium]
MQDWLDRKDLRQHNTSRREIANLLEVVDRDLQDASVTVISPDRRFATAYNAVLQLATVVLYASGYRAAGKGHHWITISVLPDIMGSDAQERMDYFNNCRTKRHGVDYDRADIISLDDVDELLREAEIFRDEVLTWLKANRPDLLED